MSVAEKQITCKHCSSTNIVKYGTYKGVQRYWCKACKRKFKADNALFHMQSSPELISTAMEMYYTGSSVEDICQHFRNTKGYYPSKSVVFGWIDKYTDKMVKHFRQYKPELGDEWECDETVLFLDKKKKVWFWDIIDTKTRYLIASHVSTTRTTKDAQRIMEKAQSVAGKSPKTVTTDKLYAYWDGIELTFGADTEHVQGSPFSHGVSSTAKIERMHSFIKERTKVMKAFRNVDTLIHFMDGLITYFNYIKPHHSLKGKTPAEAAKIEYTVKNWDAVCRLPVAKSKPIINRKVSEPKFRRPPERKTKEPKLGKPHYSRGLGGMTRRLG